MEQFKDSSGARNPQPSSLQTLAPLISQVLVQESLKKELRFAQVRVLVLLLSATLDSIVFFFPQLLQKDSISPTIALISISASIVSIGIVVLLRRSIRYEGNRWLQIALPIFDGSLLAGFITNIADILGMSQPQITTNIAALCCVFAVSGGVRLNRRAAIITTLLAVANLLYAGYLFELTPTISIFTTITVIGAGALGIWIATIVRRQVKSEAGRLVMERFLPKTVVETAFESPLELLEQPRVCDVTIVITDLREFTRYAQNTPPDQVFSFLNRLQSVLSQTVEEHGGWVDKFMGDGMLAVFGVPEAIGNHAQKAYEASIAMRENVQAFSPLEIGIGIHSGTVVAGCLGTSNHLEFTVVGDTVNVAARIEELTKHLGHPVLISAATQQQLNGSKLKSLGNQVIRGRSERLEIFTVNPQSSGVTRDDAIA
ncbi:MAG: adenylate/guanylate cyclase domain-containing protein [Cyanobacteria bacterium P01_A01_bin.37]